MEINPTFPVHLTENKNTVAQWYTQLDLICGEWYKKKLLV